MPALDVVRLWRGVPVLAFLLLGGCSSLSYYSQLASGQWQLLQARTPVAEVLADPGRDPRLRQHLALAQQARRFASEHLHLPDNQSYRLYADIGRPYVVWNVFATEEFSLTPVTHCFPIAGCVAYRGYYSQGRARGAAALQKQAGQDVYVAGIEAYSTLGWFSDPILNTMLGWGDERLAALIFHELAHQRFYVQDDTAFNESYASFVEQQGARQWRAARGLPAQDDIRSAQRDALTALVLEARQRLQVLYAQPLPAPVMRERKAAEFERLRHEYRTLRDRRWPGDTRFDAWINAPLNNARLLPFGLYEHWVPAFAAVFAQVGGDWPRFYARVEHLGTLTPAERTAALQALMPAVQHP
ncbi:aminopeptidase [Pseudomonas syringae]|nr:aminopeptidase [Pseudomonas syringae]MBD8788174.1 aminopeptidase [Pseudomonas syringae]MBD8799627.1 aminopeptidase [Pseudomonas syringae]MBD8812707.1 aminopeptidase [Pseudomonas syringae]